MSKRRSSGYINGCALIIALMLGAAAWAQGAVAPDPTRLSLGCRVIGIGKAFIGLADDVSAVYTNPSGLALLERWQVNSFSGKFIDEFNYISLTGAYPTNYGTFGLGIAGASIGGAPVTRVKPGTEADPIFELDSTQLSVSYYNNVFILGYGFSAKTAPPYIKDLFKKVPYLDRLNYGLSLKLFSAGLAGDSISQGTASGMEMDAGVLFQATPWLRVGTTMQNLLPLSLGGKLRYANGHEESYPAIFEAGVSAKILGKNNALRDFAQDILLIADYDMYPVRRHPPLVHLGIEWSPVPMIAVRAGIDQDLTGDGTGGMKMANNLTGGVGLTYAGFRFDYAFHQFESAPGSNNHFFAFTLGLPQERAEAKKEFIKLKQPADKTIMFDPTVIVSGEVTGFEAAALNINKVPVKMRNMRFEASVPLNIGKNVISPEAFDKVGSLLEGKRIRALRLAAFPDVAPTYWTREQIGYIAAMGIIKGYPDGRFKPEGNITRAEMATLLIRTNVSEEAIQRPKKSLFKDVQLDHWAIRFITSAANNGIVKGYPDGTYRPNANITRAEGLLMATRFANVTEEAYFMQFRDVNSRHWAAKTIAGAFKVGMLNFLLQKPFEPNKKLNRAESVEILYRSPYVQQLINKSLLNWESY